MKGIAKFRRIDIDDNQVNLYDSVGSEVEGSLNSALLALAVPVAITWVSSYFITKWAYPKDFSLFKWVGVPLAIGVVGFVSTITSAIVFSKKD